MKSLISVLIVTIMFIPVAHSQLRIGIIGGWHSSSINEKNSIPGWQTSTKPYMSHRESVHVGLTSSIPLNINNLYFEPALTYQTKGRKYAQFFDTARAKATDTAYSRSDLLLNYVEIPLNLTYRIPFRKRVNFVLSAGPYLSFFYYGKRKIAALTYSDNVYTRYDVDVQAGSYNNKVQTIDLGMNGRAGVEVGSMMLYIYASRGFTNFYTTPYNGSFHHQQVGATIGFWLNNENVAKTNRRKKPRDSDGDGIVDSLDACPLQRGSRLTQGCPDRDHDGVADGVDKCPDVPGLAKYNGCPIPDTDKDGINDEGDKCPLVPGFAKFNGCPVADRDGDGIPDDRDKCPDIPGSPRYLGCPAPDRDKDSIPDEEDKCPTIPGPRSNNGCPLFPKTDLGEELNKAAKLVYFTPNSEMLTISSYQELNGVAAMLKANPSASMNIDGYTDNSGNAVRNRQLSQKRADAVKRYLMQWHIDGRRLKAVGYGSQNPIADNSTPEGRTQNRRVEFKLVRQ